MIEFGQVKSKLLILLIYPVGIIFARICTIYHHTNPYFFLFLFFISHFFAIIPLFIYKINKKNYFENRNSTVYNKEDSEMKNQLEILKEQIKKKQKKNKILIFFIIGILYFFSYLFFYYYNYITTTTFYGNISIVMEIVYLSLFNWLIFGKKIYSHHFLSMLIITFSILGLYILLMINYIRSHKDWDATLDFIFPTLLNFIAYCSFCFFLVKSKQYIENNFISIYELIIYLGIFCSSLLMILEPFSFFIKCKNKIVCPNGYFAGIFMGFKQSASLKGTCFSLGIILSLFMTAIGLWLTVKILSPIHFLTSDSLITVELNILVDFYNDKQLINNPLFYIFSLITIFGCLVYNEIIIINICYLNYNTRKEIIKRQSKEFKGTICELSEYNRDTMNLDI